MLSPDSAQTSRYTIPASYEPTELILDIKRSEFIGMIRRVDSEDQARDWIEEVRSQYYDATHVCTAFVIGPDRDIQRSNDDGEPAGTAGLPMMQALLNHRVIHDGVEYTDLSDVCAIAVRYFGGIKLGAGGLVRAYSDTVVETLQATSLIPRQRLLQANIKAPHALAGRWENEIRAQGTQVFDTEYGATEATLHLGLQDVPKAVEDFEAQLASITGGQATVEIVGSEWA